MIVYDKFWETMKRCEESTYTLINHYNISSGTIDRIRKGQGITTAKLDDFCQIFHCRVEDLITYVEPADGEPHSPYSEKSPKESDRLNPKAQTAAFLFYLGNTA